MDAFITNIAIEKLKPNPYRNLETYPWNEAKIADLQRSYAEVGMWEGVIARPVGDHFEIPFAHHRVEAARRNGVKEIPTIVRSLTNEQMIRMMAHENSEDYSTDFVVQLNTWEGGIQYFGEISQELAKKPEPLEIARFLGMTRLDDKGKQGDRLDVAAEACNAAHALIQSGHLSRSDLIGLNVSAARELTQAILSQMQLVDKLAQIQKAPASSVAKAKGYVATAGKHAAEGVRKGEVPTKRIRMEVSANAFSNAAKAAKDDKPLPLLTAFADALCRHLSKTLTDDYAAEKLGEIAKALSSITLEDDHAALRRVQFELGEIGKRADRWAKRITPDKVTSLKALEDKS